MKEDEKIVLFYPHVPVAARDAARKVLDTRWIGQGPKVDKFEALWTEKFAKPSKSIAVGSGTDALHLAYILAGVSEGDEVVTPLFTCTATNTPILYQKAKPVFADVKKDSLNVDPKDVARKVTPRTKAIVCVDYGGLPADLDELQEVAEKWQIPLIEDAAQAQGAKYKGRYVGSVTDFTCFSFQAIKIIAAPDSGMLTIRNSKLEDTAKRIRWFGIDRKTKQESHYQGIWAGDIWELGWKYQMTDISAAMGIEAMKVIDETLKHHRELFEAYWEGLKGIPGISFIGDDKIHQSSCWLATALVENRDNLRIKLTENGIESDPVHYRNDRYSIFGKRVNDCPNMDALENKYLVLPKHFYVTVEDVGRICDVIRSGW
ncbi:DegT/DnrJ/EryC1/StrS aminotransferase [Candidatus Woesebacteria bacterium RIFOXYA1_FULL_40_18]|uniref:DegT/DnrJ/EryC1/StrS aminotransferase n=2 Tax=Candidatus Woeseibacteriota TaxID=1752722 RepID=A0A1F8CJF4_9BACT|nr:MAG: DegT/DnrJ/EryC1/StrS aminotransferase [Candidatus Woesebacteria bacterium RIFOXYA1_FULL_40_18]OGM80632.1 MAG: DegT/DnrJ/EryC1/StrS aminotransferase [Candidatus Woesebacteria bacterium RIFOXYB1_FULL_40_26]